MSEKRIGSTGLEPGTVVTNSSTPPPKPLSQHIEDAAEDWAYVKTHGTTNEFYAFKAGAQFVLNHPAVEGAREALGVFVNSSIGFGQGPLTKAQFVKGAEALAALDELMGEKK